MLSLWIACPANAAPDTKEEIGRYSLSQCLSTAFEQNYDLQKAREQIERQNGVRIEARARLLPRLDAKASYQKIDSNRISSFNGQQFGSDQSWNAEVEVSQNIFRGGSDAALYNREQRLSEAVKNQFLAVANDVLSQVRERFYRVLLARAKVKVQEQSVSLLEEELRSEKAKLAAGTVSQFNVLRAEVELANSKAPLIRARNELRIAREELAQIMGLPESAMRGEEPIVDVEGELEFAPVTLSIDDALSQADESRPELKQLKHQVEAESERVRAERGAYYPELSAYASYGADKSPFTDELDEKDSGWKAGVRGNWNIFNSFGTAGRVQQAISDEQVARLSKQQRQLDISIEVRRAYSALIEAEELVTASKKVVEQAEESLRLARSRLDAGAGTQLEVLDTQVALTDARANEIQALYDFNTARARMDLATGAVLRPAQ